MQSYSHTRLATVNHRRSLPDFFEGIGRLYTGYYFTARLLSLGRCFHQNVVRTSSFISTYITTLTRAAMYNLAIQNGIFSLNQQFPLNYLPTASGADGLSQTVFLSPSVASCALLSSSAAARDAR